MYLYKMNFKTCDCNAFVVVTTCLLQDSLFKMYVQGSSLGVPNNMHADVVGDVEMVNWWQCVDDIEAVCFRRTHLT